MVNYNMGDTMKIAVCSLASQLDERFEIVIVDDGSTDNSREVIKGLATSWPCLNFHFLPRDKNRKLGYTRNYSIKKARGEYVLLHLDCDDVFGTNILDFVEVFRQLENAKSSNFMLAGDHVNMAKKRWLEELGPYNNIFRGEDRDLWVRLSLEDKILFLEHRRFIERLPKSLTERLYRYVYYNIDHIKNDFKGSTSFRKFMKYEIQRIGKFPMHLIIYRVCLSLIFSSYYAVFKSQKIDDCPIDFESYNLFKVKHSGTFSQLMAMHNAKPDFDLLSASGKLVFK